MYIYHFVGLYKKDDRHTECHKCASGYYNNVFCSTECEICPEGYYCPVSVLSFATKNLLPYIVNDVTVLPFHDRL